MRIFDKKIIEKIADPSAQTLLSYICSINVDGFNTEILYKLLRLKKKNFEDLSLLYPEQSCNVLHIHDLVKKALRKNDDSNCKYLEFLNSIVSESEGKMTTAILHQAYLSRSILKSLLNQTFNDKLIWLYYLMLQINGEERDFVTKLFLKKEIDNKTSLQELLCIIDSNENSLIRSTSISKGNKDAPYQNWITRLENASQIFANNNEYLIKIFHHLGKACRRVGKYNDAKKIF